MTDHVAPEPLDTIAGSVRAEIEVSRSRFIADLVPIADEPGASDVVAAARREFHGARHHCSAWVLGPDGQRVRSNDDGEPAGTAGAPMLAVLEGAALTDVVAVVTRYFGGTLLGAGGLVRAYGDTVSAAVVAAERRRRRLVSRVEVQVAHAEAGKLEHLLRRWVEDARGAVDDVRYGPTAIHLVVAVPLDEKAELLAALAASGVTHRVGELGEAIRALR